MMEPTESEHAFSSLAGMLHDTSSKEFFLAHAKCTGCQARAIGRLTLVVAGGYAKI